MTAVLHTDLYCSGIRCHLTTAILENLDNGASGRPLFMPIFLAWTYWKNPHFYVRLCNSRRQMLTFEHIRWKSWCFRLFLHVFTKKNWLKVMPQTKIFWNQIWNSLFKLLQNRATQCWKIADENFSPPTSTDACKCLQSDTLCGLIEYVVLL